MARNIQSVRVLSSWATIVEYGAGHGDMLYKAIEEELRSVNMPHVSWTMEDATTGYRSGSREYAVFTHDNLREYSIYLFCHDIGSHLDCGWFLTVLPGTFKKFLSKKMTGNPYMLSEQLNIFAQQDLSAWRFIIHRTLVRCVRELMQQLNQDVSGMDTQSKGFLSVW
jgi:hypothetical protein